MKHIALTILLVSSSFIICAPRPHQIETRAKVVDPLPDDVRDTLLLTSGAQIATSIIQAMIHNEDPKDHVCEALNGLYSFIQALVRNPGIDSDSI